LVERGGGDLPATAGVLLVLDFHISRMRRRMVGTGGREGQAIVGWVICLRGGGGGERERERETFAVDCRFFCCSSA
jgi:hypothetical protein